MKTVVKENGRLCVKVNNKIIYTPPDHLRTWIRSRDDLTMLLTDSTPFIDLVLAFESIIWNRYLEKQGLLEKFS
jgi:hypothetical protein